MNKHHEVWLSLLGLVANQPWYIYVGWYPKLRNMDGQCPLAAVATVMRGRALSRHSPPNDNDVICTVAAELMNTPTLSDSARNALSAFVAAADGSSTFDGTVTSLREAMFEILNPQIGSVC